MKLLDNQLRKKSRNYFYFKVDLIFLHCIRQTKDTPLNEFQLKCEYSGKWSKSDKNIRKELNTMLGFVWKFPACHRNLLTLKALGTSHAKTNFPIGFASTQPIDGYELLGVLLIYKFNNTIKILCNM